MVSRFVEEQPIIGVNKNVLEASEADKVIETTKLIDHVDSIICYTNDRKV